MNLFILNYSSSGFIDGIGDSVGSGVGSGVNTGVGVTDTVGVGVGVTEGLGIGVACSSGMSGIGLADSSGEVDCGGIVCSGLAEEVTVGKGDVSGVGVDDSDAVCSKSTEVVGEGTGVIVS